MSFATFLVHVEPDPTVDPRLALAVDLANQFDAMLIGVGAEIYSALSLGEGYAAEIAIGDVEANLRRAEEKFRAIAGTVHQGTQWRSAMQFPVTGIANESRAADLVITGHSNHAAASYTVGAPGPLILETGRPVLAVPPEAKTLTVANVVVAWKDTREARRAVTDALPFLKAAREVLLVEITDSTSSVPLAREHVTEVSDHLRRHGIETTVMIVAEAKVGSAADQLLDIAEQQKADLIVAGGYGHGRLREWVFGGFTRALIAQKRHAVLFSH